MKQSTSQVTGLLVDFSNAFNSIDRGSGVPQAHPLLQPAQPLAGKPLPTQLQWPLGFALTLQPIIDRIQSDPGLALIGSPNDLRSLKE